MGLRRCTRSRSGARVSTCDCAERDGARLNPREIGGRSGSAQFQFTLQGENLAELAHWGPLLIKQLRRVPGSDVAQVWGIALLASMGGVVFQINTLSFAYHSSLWIFFGLVGAWTGAIRHHWPEFDVKLTWRDLFAIATACLVYLLIVLPIFLRAKGEM